MPCPFCRSLSFSASGLPPVHFNDKFFTQVECNHCRLIYIDPLPDQDDLDKMYPLQYQDGVDTTLLPDTSVKMPGLRFSYKYQLGLIRKFSKANELLDHGCGTGHFIANAAKAGFACSGTEFN